MESLHTILLGPVKYFLNNLMDRLTSDEKDVVEAKIDSIKYSGIDGRINGKSICRCVHPSRWLYSYRSELLN